MLKKGLAVAVILLFIGMCVVPSTGTVIKQSYEQLSSGNTLYVGGSGANNYTTIQSAINDTVDGDTVFVYDDSSPYYEVLIINKSINLVGEDRNTTCIETSYDEVTIISITADSTTVQGFTISGVAYAGIGIMINSNYCVIRYNNIESGISVGVHLNKAHYSLISNNNIINHYRGIILERITNHTIITNNIITDCRIGILNRGFNNNFLNNTIQLSKDIGIVLGGGNCIADNNTIINNDGDGIKISTNGWESVISNNTIDNNDDGIQIYNGNDILITKNTISNNDIGLRLDECENCIITNNNFISNIEIGFLIRFITLHHNYWNANYWGRARIFPKLILGLYLHYNPYYSLSFYIFNIDWNPAQEPYDIGV